MVSHCDRSKYGPISCALLTIRSLPIPPCCTTTMRSQLVTSHLARGYWRRTRERRGCREKRGEDRSHSVSLTPHLPHSPPSANRTPPRPPHPRQRQLRRRCRRCPSADGQVPPPAPTPAPAAPKSMPDDVPTEVHGPCCAKRWWRRGRCARGAPIDPPPPRSPHTRSPAPNPDRRVDTQPRARPSTHFPACSLQQAPGRPLMVPQPPPPPHSPPRPYDVLPPLPPF